jgi:acetyl esterase/lipase
MKKQEEMTPDELAKLTVLYTVPGMEDVTIRRDETYRTTEAGPLTIDVYCPPGTAAGAPLPAVVIVYGYSDAGFPNVFGRTFKEMGAPVSWARLIAASGMIAILYSNREPADDAMAVLRYVRQHASSLGIDGTRIGLWAASANVPVALSLLMQQEVPVACAALCNGYMLDVDGATGVADIQKTYRFANPCAGKSVDDVRKDVPLLIVRSGRDRFPGLNESLDNFVRGALRGDLPLTLVNHADAPHGFDLFHDSETTREIIRGILSFLRFHLSA